MSEDLAEIKSLIEETGKGFSELQSRVDKQVDEMKAGRTDPVLKESIDKLAKDVAGMSMDKDNAERIAKTTDERLSKMEADMSCAGGKATGSDEQQSKENDLKYSKAMISFIRKGVELTQEEKALSVGHDPDGGYWVSPTHSSQIIKKIFETSPMRQVAGYETIGTDALDMPEDINDMAGGWSGEVASRSETDTAEIGLRRIPVHELSAMPKATQKLLDDAVINVESWLAMKQGDKFSRLENTAFVTGTGAGQPRGFATYDSGTTNPGQIERLTTAANDTLDDVDLVSMLYKLKAPYRLNSTWAFNRNTLATISKIQDGQGRFVFQPGLQAGAPSSLLGRPMIEFNDMADDANGTLPVAIADWKQAYTVVDRRGITILRDPYSSKPHILFYTTKRVGGDVMNFEAIKLMVIQ